MDWKKLFFVSCLAAGPLMGSGFSVQEQSVRAQGYAFAGATSAAEDISYMFFNPAAVNYQCGYQVSANVSYIIPNNHVKNISASNAIDKSFPAAPTTFSDPANKVFVPAVYASMQLPNCWWAGLAVTAPYGLVTEYNSSWYGRYHAIKSDLKTIDINPVVGWSPYCWLSLAMGPTFQYADVELTNAIDFGSSVAQPGLVDGKSVLKGDNWGMGATFGAIIEPNECWRIGIAYKTQVFHNITGTADVTMPITNGVTTYNTTGYEAEAAAKMPGRLHLGVTYFINDCWAVMADYQFTEWSKFKELRVNLETGSQDLTVESWDDTSFFALGTSYKFNNCWTSRFGIAYDQSPVPEETRTPRIPDSDRFWVSGGATYNFGSCWALDLAATYIWVDDAKIRLKATDVGNQLRGNLNADYTDGNIIILSAALNWRW